MKLIDADKLRESLEFNLMVYQKLADKQTPVNAEFVVNDLKRFMCIIDEAPDLSLIDSKELDEAAERYANAIDENSPHKWMAQVDFKAGAKWQAQHSLNWEDMQAIVKIADELAEYAEAGIIEPFLANEEAYYNEILKRFNESRK